MDTNLKSRKTNSLIIGAGVLFVVVLGWILVETIRAKNTGFEEQNLWEWMKLLIVPLLIPISVFWLTYRTEENERTLEKYKARKEELQNYFDRMTNLLLKHQLRVSAEDSEIRTIARALTLSVAPELSENQKSQLLLFLYDAGLIFRFSSIIGLEKIDLQNLTIQPKTDLRRISICEANLQGCNFEDVNLYYADFKSSKLQNANFAGAILMQASLRNAALTSATLKGASLKDADLRWANLKDANLEDANLEDADLRRADLTGATFTNAVLVNTRLKDAIVSEAQLRTAQLLRNVTMPDGTILSSVQTT